MVLGKLTNSTVSLTLHPLSVLDSNVSSLLDSSACQPLKPFFRQRGSHPNQLTSLFLSTARSKGSLKRWPGILRPPFGLKSSCWYPTCQPNWLTPLSPHTAPHPPTPAARNGLPSTGWGHRLPSPSGYIVAALNAIKNRSSSSKEGDSFVPLRKEDAEHLIMCLYPL